MRGATGPGPTLVGRIRADFWLIGAGAVRTVGAFAGIASIVVLVVLAILYRKHAREVRSLADRTPAPQPPRAHTPPSPKSPTARFDPLATTARQRGEPSPRSRTGVVLALVAALAMLGVIAIVAFGDSGAKHKEPARQAPAPRRLVAADVRVRVFNTTAAAGLGRQVSARLRRRGFRTGTRSNALPARPQTVVAYRRGQRAAARMVGRALGVDAAQPLGPRARQAGGADVIVLVGADQAR